VWQAAHGRLYEFLRDTTKEGDQPNLKDLDPLYQAIAHGCRAGRHQEALDQVYVRRICRGDECYAQSKLGAIGSNLAAISWFFDQPYENLAVGLIDKRQPVMNQAAMHLRAQGRLTDALPVHRALLLIDEREHNWRGASIAASNLSEAELVVGDIPGATRHAETAVEYAKRAGDRLQWVLARSSYSTALQTAGRGAEAFELFADAEQRLQQLPRNYPLLWSVRGHQYCDLLLAKGNWVTVRDRATQTHEWARQHNDLFAIALDQLSLGRAQLGLALTSENGARNSEAAREFSSTAYACLGQAADGLRSSERLDYLPKSLLAQATFHRSMGNWAGAARHLDEVEEIAQSGPMQLFFCDMALERARLAFARIEGFAPLNGLTDDSPPKPKPPNEAERQSLYDEAAKQLPIAADYIHKCGYHLRDEELTELQAVLRGERTFASLPPRV